MHTFLALLVSTPIYLQGILLAVLGVAGTYITQVVKRLAGVGGKAAVILTVLISVVLAVVVLVFTGDITNIKDVIGSSGVIFTLATVAYRFLLAAETPVK